MADPLTDAPIEAEPAAVDEAMGWSGWKLDGYDVSGVGRVEGVLTDVESGEPAWLLVRMGRFGHFSVVPFELAAAGVGRVWVPFDRELIRAAPQLEPGSQITREIELELCGHFALPSDRGRAAALAGRTEGSQTAVPAAASG